MCVYICVLWFNRQVYFWPADCVHGYGSLANTHKRVLVNNNRPFVLPHIHLYLLRRRERPCHLAPPWPKSEGSLRREASRSRTVSPSTARQRMILCSKCLLIETVLIIIRVSSVTSHSYRVTSPDSIITQQACVISEYHNMRTRFRTEAHASWQEMQQACVICSKPAWYQNITQACIHYASSEEVEHTLCQLRGGSCFQ